MTISARKLEANRRNARKSTGPRTDAGKARSRMNAVTHGLTAQTIVLPDEDPREYQRRLDEWADALKPANDYEQHLAKHAASLSWRLERAERVQAELMAQSIAAGSDAEVRRRREALDDAARRLWPELAAAGSPALAGPDDPDDPLTLAMRLEALV